MYVNWITKSKYIGIAQSREPCGAALPKIRRLKLQIKLLSTLYALIYLRSYSKLAFCIRLLQPALCPANKHSRLRGRPCRPGAPFNSFEGISVTINRFQVCGSIFCAIKATAYCCLFQRDVKKQICKWITYSRRPCWSRTLLKASFWQSS